MANFRFDFPETPTGDIGILWRAVVKLLPQLAPRMSIIKNVEVKTEETPVAHGLKKVPLACLPIPHNLQIACPCKNPDATNVYVRASELCVCDVVVFQ